MSRPATEGGTAAIHGLRRVAQAALCAVAVLSALPAPAAARAFSAGAGGGGDPYFPGLGNGGYQATHYDITFSYDPPTRRMAGSTRMAAVATQYLSRFNLDFVGMTVRDVSVNGTAATFSRQGQELVVTPPAGLPRGQSFDVAVSYDGEPSHLTDPDGSPDGWIRTDDGAYVACEPQGAMTWFPGNHDLRDKATHFFNVKVPDGTTAVANGYLASTRSSGGKTTFVWKSFDPMANYLATATIGKFSLTKTRTVTGISNFVAVDPRTGGGAVGQTAAIVEGLAAIFGPYPFWVMGGIVDYAPSVTYALETQTKPLYPGPPPTSLVVHELAHQWYGDSVTPATWRDIWLNEGFATYAEWLWSERNGGATAQQHFNSAYAVPAGDPFWQVRPGDPGAANMFHRAVYDRGAMTLQALRASVGGRPFFEILEAWATERRYGNGSTAQFVALAERLSGKQLDSLFQRWLYDVGKPAWP